MCYAVPGLCIQTVSSISRHSCIFAYTQIGSILFTLLLPITKASLLPVSVTMFSFRVQCVSNCFTDKLLMLRHLGVGKCFELGWGA